MLLASLFAANQAEALTASQFIKYCESERATEQMFCSGVLHGIATTNRTLDKVGQQKFFCPSDEIKEGDLEKVLLQHASDHPENLTKNATEHAILVFIKNYPCGEAQQK